MCPTYNPGVNPGHGPAQSIAKDNLRKRDKNLAETGAQKTNEINKKSSERVKKCSVPLHN